jgi:hypothetical protein
MKIFNVLYGCVSIFKFDQAKVILKTWHISFIIRNEKREIGHPRRTHLTRAEHASKIVRLFFGVVYCRRIARLTIPINYGEFKKNYSYLIGVDLLELLELKDVPLN